MKTLRRVARELGDPCLGLGRVTEYDMKGGEPKPRPTTSAPTATEPQSLRAVPRRAMFAAERESVQSLLFGRQGSRNSIAALS